VVFDDVKWPLKVIPATVQIFSQTEHIAMYIDAAFYWCCHNYTALPNSDQVISNEGLNSRQNIDIEFRLCYLVNGVMADMVTTKAEREIGCSLCNSVISNNPDWP